MTDIYNLFYGAIHPWPGMPEGIRIPRCAGCGCLLGWVLQRPDIKPDGFCLCDMCCEQEQAAEDRDNGIVRQSGRA